MARARNIKPGVFKNEVLVELPAFTRLLFIGLWTLADREGRIEDRPKKIKLELFPYDQEDIECALSCLHAAGFIDRYEAGGTKVIEVVNFLRHQTPHGTEKDSILPDRNGDLTINERGKTGHVTGTKRRINVKSTQNNVGPPVDTETSPGSYRPDLLIPDSLNPDSLIGERSPEGDSLDGRPSKPKVKSGKTTLAVWLASCQALGDDPIPEGDPIFAWADSVQLPDEYLDLAWSVFKRDMTDKGKLQTDWRATFRTYVRKGYLKLWAIGPDGYFLTTVGKQEAMAHGKP